MADRLVDRFDIRLYDQVSSTNTLVKEALKAGEPEGVVIAALRQCAGYGRSGRSWVSPEGGMYMSILLRPHMSADQLSTLSLVVGVAVRRALAELVQNDDLIGLKWPNDVVVMQPDGTGAHGGSFQKLCGISLEALYGGVCVGIGVNVTNPHTAVVFSGTNTPAYVNDYAPNAYSIDEVRDAVLRYVGDLYDTWCERGFTCASGDMRAHDALAGKELEVVNRRGDVMVCGRALGVDEAGCLLVRSSERKETLAIASGEAHIVPLS